VHYTQYTAHTVNGVSDKKIPMLSDDGQQAALTLWCLFNPSSQSSYQWNVCCMYVCMYYTPFSVVADKDKANDAVPNCLAWPRINDLLVHGCMSHVKWKHGRRHIYIYIYIYIHIHICYNTGQFY